MSPFLPIDPSTPDPPPGCALVSSAPARSLLALKSSPKLWASSQSRKPERSGSLWGFCLLFYFFPNSRPGPGVVGGKEGGKDGRTDAVF